MTACKELRWLEMEILLWSFFAELESDMRAVLDVAHCRLAVAGRAADRSHQGSPSPVLAAFDPR